MEVSQDLRNEVLNYLNGGAQAAPSSVPSAEVPQEVQQEGGFGDMLKSGLQDFGQGISAGIDRLGASTASIFSEAARISGDKDYSRYEEAKQRRALKDAQDVEKNLGLVGNIASMGVQMAPTIGSMFIPGGAAARFGATLGTSTGQTYGDILSTQKELGQDFDSESAIKAAMTAGIIDASIGKFLPAGGKPLARVATEAAGGAASGGQNQILANLATGQDWNQNLGTAMVAGGVLGGGIGGINQALGYSINQGGQDAVNSVSRWRNDNRIDPKGDFITNYAEYENKAFRDREMMNETSDPNDLVDLASQKVTTDIKYGAEAAYGRAVNMMDEAGVPYTDAALNIDITDFNREQNLGSFAEAMGSSRDKAFKAGEDVRNARPTFVRNRKAKDAGETKVSHYQAVQDAGKGVLGKAMGSFRDNVEVVNSYLKDNKDLPRSQIKELEGLKSDLSNLENLMRSYTGNKKETPASAIRDVSERAYRRAAELGMLNSLKGADGKVGNWSPIQDIKTVDVIEQMLKSEYPSFHMGAPDVPTEKGRRSAITPADAAAFVGGGVPAYIAKRVGEGIGNTVGGLNSQRKLRKAKEVGATRGESMRNSLELARKPTAAEAKVESALKSGNMAGAADLSQADLESAGINTTPSDEPSVVNTQPEAALDVSTVVNPTTPEPVTPVRETNIAGVMRPKTAEKPVVEPVEPTPEPKREPDTAMASTPRQPLKRTVEPEPEPVPEPVVEPETPKPVRTDSKEMITTPKKPVKEEVKEEVVADKVEEPVAEPETIQRTDSKEMVSTPKKPVEEPAPEAVETPVEPVVEKPREKLPVGDKKPQKAPEEPTEPVVEPIEEPVVEEPKKVSKPLPVSVVKRKEEISRLEQIPFGKRTTKVSSELARLREEEDSFRKIEIETKATPEIVAEAQKRVSKEDFNKGFGIKSWKNEVYKILKEKREAEKVQSKKAGDKAKESFDKAIDRIKESYAKKEEVLLASKETAESKLKNDWESVDKAFKNSPLSKDEAEDILNKLGLVRGEKVNPVSVRREIYRKEKELSKEPPMPKEVAPPKENNKYSLQEVNSILTKEADKLGISKEDAIAMIGRKTAFEKGDITPSTMRSIMRDFDAAILKKSKDLADEIKELANRDKLEERRLQEWLKRADEGDERATSAQISAIENALKTTRKRLKETGNRLTKTQQYLADKRESEAQLVKDLEASRKFGEELDAKIADMDKLGLQVEKVKAKLAEKGADEDFIDTYVSDHLAFRDKPFTDTQSAINAALNKLNSYQKAAAREQKVSDNIAKQAGDETSNLIEDMTPVELKGVLKYLESNLDNVDGDIEKLKVYTAQLDAVLSKKKELKEAVSEPVMAASEVVKDAVKFASEMKTEFPNNPELWMSRDTVRKLGKAWTGEEGKKEYGSWFINLRAAIFGDTKITPNLSKTKIEEKATKIKLNESIKADLGSDFKLK